MAFPPENGPPVGLDKTTVLGKGGVAAQIMHHRSAFMTYNIGRIRELMRYLTPKKNRLFQTIPFWLHVNAPHMPGYSGTPHTPFGIYRFHESGFFKQALSLLKISPKKIRPYLPNEDPILGVYLMGSSGTLAQSGNSDFDYWVLVDEGALGASRLSLLQKKLTLIETHCRDRYQQSVTFFILDKHHARANQFEALDSESAGSSHKILLKEEFYRTFIMIAGKIPFWAVLPPGLSDEEYQQWIYLSKKDRHLRFIPDDYIDLGSLPSFDAREALGALLWQIYKARNAPAKSFIKAALILYYFFFYEKEGFLCDQIKERFLQGGNAGQGVDPYVMLFDKAHEVIESLENKEMLSLLKKSIFLRLSGYQPLRYREEKTPKAQMLHRLVSQWQWSQRTIDRFLSFGKWSEEEKLGFERDIFKSLSFFYEIVLRAQGNTQTSVDMTDKDLRVLTNQIDAYFKSSPGKIPRCSAFLKRSVDKYQFVVLGQEGPAEGMWSVFLGGGRSALGTGSLLFKGPEILKVAGWLISNKLYHPTSGAFSFQGNLAHRMSGAQAQRIVKKAHRFFKHHDPAAPSTGGNAYFTNLFVLICMDSTARGRFFEKADFLVMNTWGVFHFDTLALSKIETREAACYSVAEQVWMLMKQVPGYQLKIQVSGVDGGLPAEVVRAIDENIERFKKNRVQLERLQKRAQEPDDDVLPLLLDI